MASIMRAAAKEYLCQIFLSSLDPATANSIINPAIQYINKEEWKRAEMIGCHVSSLLLDVGAPWVRGV